MADGAAGRRQKRGAGREGDPRASPRDGRHLSISEAVSPAARGDANQSQLLDSSTVKSTRNRDGRKRSTKRRTPGYGNADLSPHSNAGQREEQ